MFGKRKCRTTLSNLSDFLKKESKKFRTYYHGGYSGRFETEMKRKLTETLKSQIFQDHSRTWYIPDQNSLQARILAQDTTPNGAPYNQEYLEHKRSIGETKPHKYKNYAFWHGLSFTSKFRSVTLEQHMPYNTGKKFDYVSHHEENRSVLKATFLLGFEDLVDTMLELYAFMIENGTSI